MATDTQLLGDTSELMTIVNGVELYASWTLFSTIKYSKVP